MADWTDAGAGIVNSIIDNGDNTLTVITTMGADGTNNKVSKTQIYGWVVDSGNSFPSNPPRPNVGESSNNNNFFSTTPESIDNTTRIVIHKIAAPKVYTSNGNKYAVRIVACSITQHNDNKAGTYVDAYNLNYYVNPISVDSITVSCTGTHLHPKEDYLISWPKVDDTEVKYELTIGDRSYVFDTYPNQSIRINPADYGFAVGDELQVKIRTFIERLNNTNIYSDYVESNKIILKSAPIGKLWVRTDEGWKKCSDVYTSSKEG